MCSPALRLAIGTGREQPLAPQSPPLAPQSPPLSVKHLPHPGVAGAGRERLGAQLRYKSNISEVSLLKVRSGGRPRASAGDTVLGKAGSLVSGGLFYVPKGAHASI